VYNQYARRAKLKILENNLADDLQAGSLNREKELTYLYNPKE
jgi:hypothetical protein